MTRIGITLGDVTGIGPEITLQALARELPADSAAYLILGDPGVVADWNDRLGLKLPMGNQARVAVLDPTPGRALDPRGPQGNPAAARAAAEWVGEAARLCLRGELAAMVTAPVNKHAIVRAGISFVGQTELLAGLARARRVAMMLLGQDDRGRWLRVALATTHVSMRRLADSLTREKIYTAIELASAACRDLGLARARVAVCGLNPHAGEGGELGDEEQTLIGPVVEAARAAGVDATGPLSADALFYYAYRGDYDAVVAMYHDQGLAPLKMVAFERGVNWTLGLPFIRTSPDHGTAYDIAGTGQANPSSMIAALRLAKQLAARGK